MSCRNSESTEKSPAVIDRTDNMDRAGEENGERWIKKNYNSSLFTKQYFLTAGSINDNDDLPQYWGHETPCKMPEQMRSPVKE